MNPDDRFKRLPAGCKILLTRKEFCELVESLDCNSYPEYHYYPDGDILMLDDYNAGARWAMGTIIQPEAGDEK